MALRKCSECGATVSSTATSCPHCGHVQNRKTGFGAGLLAVLALVGLAIVGAGSGNSPQGAAAQSADATAENSSAPKEPNYKQCNTVAVGYTGYIVLESWWSDHLSTNSYLDEPPNAKYLFVMLVADNGDTKARMIPPLKLIDDSGAEYDADTRGYMLPGAIGLLDTLNPSVHKVGFIVFDAPPDKNYRLKLSGGYWSNQIALVRLKPEKSMPKDFSKSGGECLEHAVHTPKS